MKSLNIVSKFIFCAYLLVADCILSSAQILSNRLYIPDIVAWRSNTSYLSVHMDNRDDVTAVQFNVGIPKVMNVGNDAFRLSDRASDQVVQASLSGSDDDFNWYLVLVYSPTNSPFSGRAGKILDIKFTMGENVTEGSQLRIPITGGVMSRSDKTNVLQETADGKVSIEYGPDLYVVSVDINDTETAPDSTIDVSWTVKNIGEETCTAGWSEEICLTDAGATGESYQNHNVRYLATVVCDNVLEGGSAISRNASVRLPSLPGIDGNCRVMVRIVPFPESNERPENRINNVTVSNSTVNVRKRLSLQLNRLSVDEDNPGKLFATLNRSGLWNTDESFRISVTGDNRVSCPETVTIISGQSAATFDISVTDNGILDEKGLVSLIEVSDISGGTSTYQPASIELAVVDDELPQLTVETSESEIGEGDSVIFSIHAERAPDTDLILHLSCDMSGRFDFPSEILLEKDSSDTRITAYALDDVNPALMEVPTFTFWASGYQTANTFIGLIDNDIPDLELHVTPEMIGENSGIASLNVTLSRSSLIDRSITIRLSDDSTGGDIYYGDFSSFTLAEGESEKTFTIGTIDNFQADGNRDVKLTASVYIQSCGCSPGNESIGVANQTIQILDNDGPSLTVTSNRSTLAEGTAEAAVLTVTRNTSVTDSLAVSVTSDFDEGLEYSHEVIIPAGENSVRIPVGVLKNAKENDSRTVSIVASAESHNSGICWVMISDQTMADAVVADFELLTPDGKQIPDNCAVVKSSVLARVTVENTGVVGIPAGTDIGIHCSAGDGYTQRMVLSTPLAAGERTVQECLLAMPSALGTFSAYAKVNENGRAKELLMNNNTSATASLTVVPPYRTHIESSNSILQYGDSTIITGVISNRDGSDWVDGCTEVQLFVISEGLKLTKTVLTDRQGHFRYVWYPEKAQFGHFGIGACYPGEDMQQEQASVEIYGMYYVRVSDNQIYTVLEQPYEGTVAVRNPGRVSLTGLTVSVTDNPDSATVTINAPDRIEGGETVYVNYSIIGHKAPASDEWQTLHIHMSTDQGVALDRTIYYYTRNPMARLSCSTGRIITTMTKGSTRDYSFNIANIGLGQTGEITLSLPSWMQSITPKTLPSMAHGDTAQIVLRFVPTDDMLLNIPVTGQIGVNCESGNGLSIPFSIEPVSESNGNLIVDVCDEYTYYTEEAPHLSDATVRILHPVSGAVIAEGQTDSDGLCAFTLPEGYYTLSVTHQNHSSYSNSILVDPGRTLRKTVNISYNAIEISWNVVETTVSDKYEIVTTVKYETQVPAPVVTVDMPESIPARELAPGESLIFYATLTNKGLITARDVEFTLPEGLKVLQFEALEYADELFDLAPSQSVVIPVRVTNGAPQRDPARTEEGWERDPNKPLDDDDCYANTFLGYFYECGADSIYHKYPTGLRLGSCERESTSTGEGGGSVSGDDYFYGITYWFTDGKSTPNRPDTSTSQKLFDIFASDNQKKPESTGEPYKCQPCKNQVLLDLAKLIPAVDVLTDVADHVKDINNCYQAFKLEEGLHDQLANCKYTKGVTDKYDKIVSEINSMGDHFEDIFFDIEVSRQYVKDMAENARNQQLFSSESLDDLKNIYNYMSDAFNNASGIVDDVYALEKDMGDVYNSAKNIVEKADKYYTDFKKERDEWYEESSRIIFPNNWQDNRLDKLASGERAELDKKYLGDRMDNVMSYLDKSIATEKDYDVAKGALSDLIDGKKLPEKDLAKIGQSSVRVFNDMLYNSHDFREMAKNSNKQVTYDKMLSWGADFGGMSEEDIDLLTKGAAQHVPDQHLLKQAYLDNTQKAVDWMPKVTELLDHTFGDCKYAGKDPSPVRTRASYSAGGIQIIDNSIPYSYMVLMDQVYEATYLVELQHDRDMEYYGSEEWLDLTTYQLQPVTWALEKLKDKISSGDDAEKFINGPGISIYCPEGISDDAMRRFLFRWYNTYKDSITTHAGNRVSSRTFEDAIDLDVIDYYDNLISENVKKISGDRNRSIKDIINENIETALEDLTGGGSVCASISLKFDQTMVMTRQAFRGTLNVHNGNVNEPMENVILQLEVRNASDGSIATGHEMQINLESMEGFEGNLNLTDGWLLSPGADGTASILFIPTKFAAPDKAQEYTFGGRLKYLDPFTHTIVTRELSAVPLTVTPSPELDLTYFIQRDVLGDNPLTPDVVEPSEDAEFSLLVHNVGSGEAKNVVLETAQPEIVENVKGLKIDFELTASKLDGGDAVLSMGRSIVSDFGSIAPGGSRYVQWMLRSSLLGHFTDYDVTASHLTSYGNPDLSLLNEVSIHELVRSIDAGNGNTGFMVNDFMDADRMPDMLYVSDGSTETVSRAAGVRISRKTDLEYEMTVEPSSDGWNYGYVNDPTYGASELESVVRVSDGQAVSVRNFWQTDVILRDGKDPLYENRIHIADKFEGSGPEMYILNFMPMPSVWLEVESFSGIDENTPLLTKALDYLDVTFNKPINPDSFSSDDISCSVQGITVDLSGISISQIGDRTFRLDLSTINGKTGNGYYCLCVRTSGIIDSEGFSGKNGRSIDWNLYKDSMVSIICGVNPSDAGTVSVMDADSIVLAGNWAPFGTEVILSAQPSEGYSFKNWTSGGQVLSEEQDFRYVLSTGSGIQANFSLDKYPVTVIQSEDGTVNDLSGYYSFGDTLVLTATPSSSCVFENWVINGERIVSDTELVLLVNQPITVSAEFRREIFWQEIALKQGWNWISTFIDEPLPLSELSYGIRNVISQNHEAVISNRTVTGDITAIEPMESYKVNAEYDTYLLHSGHKVSDISSNVSVDEWKWLGYPWNEPGLLSEAFDNPVEGDIIISQAGFAQYYGGYWEGSLSILQPGEGYLYGTGSSRTVRYVTPDNLSHVTPDDRPANDTVDIHAYPYVMNIIARLAGGDIVLPQDSYVVYAMAGTECRGQGRLIGGKFYISVYGDTSEQITFLVKDNSSGSLMPSNESVSFLNGVLGNRKSPYVITCGDISDVHGYPQTEDETVYRIDGIMIGAGESHSGYSAPGIYIINRRKYIRK